MPLTRLYVDHVFWFFSTCAQTFAALVSVFGMFILYRLQIEEGRIGHLRERMLHFHEDHKKLPFESIIRELRRMEGEHQLRQELEHSENIRLLLSDYAGATQKRLWLSETARRPMIILVVLVVVSLAGLLLYPLYFASQWATNLLLWGTFAVSVFPLYEVGRIIFVSIRSD